jgi:hypothetical protein
MAEKYNTSISIQRILSFVIAMIARKLKRCKLAVYNKSIDQVMTFLDILELLQSQAIEI